MSEWERVRLGEVVALDIEAILLKTTAKYSIVGVLNRGRGLLFREAIGGDETSYKTLNRIRPNQIVYSRLKAFEGAITVAPNDLSEAYASQEFPTFTCGERILPEYFRLFTTTKRLWDELQMLSTGMGGRRERVKPADFLTVDVTLPSPSEQRRIVDVLTAVDAQVEALAKDVECASALLSRLNSEVVEALPASRTLGDFTATRSGPSYAAADVSPTAGPGSVPVIGIPNTKPDGSLDLSEIGHVVGLPDSVGKIDESSLVLIRTNGNRQRIGNVYMPPGEAHGHAVSAFQFLMKVNNPSQREFVYWLLREQSTQAAMSEAASGTTGLGNLAVRWLNAVQMPWSDDPAVRAAVVAPLRSLQNAVDVSSQELSRLRTLRSSLLTALLNQEIEIPESYDTLLEGAS